MKLFLYLLLVLIVSVFGISFALKNTESVSVTYYLGLDWTGSLSLLLAVTLIVGAALGVLFTLGWVIKAKRQTAHARRETAQLEREATSLRSLTEKENE